MQYDPRFPVSVTLRVLSSLASEICTLAGELTEQMQSIVERISEPMRYDANFLLDEAAQTLQEELQKGLTLEIEAGSSAFDAAADLLLVAVMVNTFYKEQSIMLPNDEDASIKH